MINFVNSLPVWGPVAVGAALVPTYQDVAALELLSKYWQPQLDRATAVLSGLGAICAYALLRKSAATKRRWTLIGSIVVLALSFVGCLFFKITSLSDRFVDTLVVDVIVYCNIVLYVVLFVSFGVALMVVYLLCGIDERWRNQVDLVGWISRWMSRMLEKARK